MRFVCPKCSSKFISFNGNSAICKNAHAYDKSREGYYNFLPPMRAGTHGDNKEMVLARRNFLDTGAYFPLADAMSSFAVEYAGSENTALVDIGCGEGYYTKIIYDKFISFGKGLELSAFDISKDAVRYAAKKIKGADFAVASAYHMPFDDASFDMAVNMFSPLALSETLRVLKKGGIFIMAIPGAEHLYEIKEVLYDTPYKNELSDFGLSGFELLESKTVKYNMNLDTKEKISSLFKMTPYAYRTKKSGIDRLFALEQLDVCASFVIVVYRKV